jgi:DNA-binding CsgD family transcriptional regulator
LIQDGNWDEADAILQNLPQPGNAYLRREITCARALLTRYRGDPGTAWAQIAPLFPDGAATEPGNICHQEGLLLQRLAAGLALDAGDLPAAMAWLEAHDRWLAWAEGVLGRADGRLAWSRWHRAADDVERARAVATEALELALSPNQPLVQFGAHVILGELAMAEGRYTEAEEHLNAALGLATACEAPYERAQALLALAELRIATRSEAGSQLAEGRAICEPLGAAQLLARLDALCERTVSKQPAAAHPAGLTEREIEVLRLVARHYTDKEIADALFISSHTASTHVKRVLSKLGASGRREVAALAAQHGLI